jgi:hypothetical protein
MSINKLTKKEIIDELQVIHYYHDEMLSTLKNIWCLFDMHEDELPHDLDVESPEQLGDYIYWRLSEIKKQVNTEK